jgi:chromosome partitioning protein
VSRDVQQLFESTGLSAFPYREIRQEQRESQALAARPWLAVARGPSIAPLSNGPRRTQESLGLVIAIVSLAPGTGRTTLAANLAEALVQAGHRCIAIDLDPAGALGSHFGVEEAGEVGIVDPLPRSAALRVLRPRHGLAFVPFGRCSRDQLARLEDLVAASPCWLDERIAPFDSEWDAVVLDTPSRACPWLFQALAVATRVLVVLAPDRESCATVPDLELLVSRVRPESPAAARYVVNRYDARRSAHREILAALRGALGNRIAPSPIQADGRVQLALSHRRCLVEEAADSQVVADLQALAEWTTGLDRQGDRSP